MGRAPWRRGALNEALRNDQGLDPWSLVDVTVSRSPERTKLWPQKMQASEFPVGREGEEGEEKEGEKRRLRKLRPDRLA
jgi:hypothetical protein